MSENEILLRGIVVGASIVLPFLAMAIGRWLYWKRTTKFWLMMHRDLSVQNERLFEIIKQEHPFKEADKVIAHHKYKRCLAMAKWCVEKYENYSLLANEAYQRGCYISEARQDRLADKWLSRKSRWLELADKFKEAK